MTTSKKKRTRKGGNCKNPQGCTGKYILGYENNAPIFTCDICQHQDLTWKKFYDEYLHLYKVKENWENEKDKISCILGLFCFKYHERFNTPYIFVPSNINPYTSKEGRDARNLLITFENDATKVRKYIVWLFTKKFNKNTAITSFGYICTPALIREYNLKEASKNILQRHSKLPASFLEWCRINVPEIFETYTLESMNDLGGLISMYASYKLGQESQEFIVLEQAKKINLINDGWKLNIK